VDRSLEDGARRGVLISTTRRLAAHFSQQTKRPLASTNRDRRAKRGFVVIFTPGSIEEMFRAVAAKKVYDVVAFARSYGTRIVGPALHPDLITRPRRMLDLAARRWWGGSYRKNISRPQITGNNPTAITISVKTRSFFTRSRLLGRRFVPNPRRVAGGMRDPSPAWRSWQWSRGCSRGPR
jgi:hypothetical protein